MEILKEVTNWNFPNHVYWVEGDKLVAFQPLGKGEVQHFKKPLRFEKTRRKFVKIGEQKPTNDKLVKVVGSKGDEYWVDTHLNTCTCPAFKFKSKCKHLCQALDASQ